MSQDLKLKVKTEPTMFNKEMLIGTILFPIVGTVIGGMIGKRRMEDEKNNGKMVSEETSSWSKETIIGGLLGLIGGHLIGNLVATALFAANPAAALVGYAATALGGALIGGYVGAEQGVKRQKQEYQEAKHQVREHEITQAVTRQMAVEEALGHNVEHASVIDAERQMLAMQQKHR